MDNNTEKPIEQAKRELHEAALKYARLLTNEIPSEGEIHNTVRRTISGFLLGAGLWHEVESVLREWIYQTRHIGILQSPSEHLVVNTNGKTLFRHASYIACLEYALNQPAITTEDKIEAIKKALGE